MRDLANRFDHLVGRVTNRLLTRFPGPSLSISTHVPVVSFTFDDVPVSALTQGAQILEAHDARGTFYIASGILGRQEENRTIIDAEGCAELAARGHELGCHTFSHANLQHLSRQALSAELDRNAQTLGEIVPDLKPHNFAAPYNAYAFRHRSNLARRFRSIRSGIAGINRGKVDRTFLRSYALPRPDAALSSMHGLIDELVDNPGWLIFFGHDLSENPTPYGCTPQCLTELVSHARNAGCAILTVDQALNQFETTA